MISIIIPVYNDVPGLTETLASLKRQTLPSDKHEIIVVNDGGGSDVHDCCKKEGVKYIEVKPNKGSYNARNKGIVAASTDKLAFIDAGVIAAEDWMEKGSEYLDKYDYVAGEVRIIKERVKDIANFHDYLTAFPVEEYFRKFGFGVTANLFLRKGIIETAGTFNASLRSGGDLEFGNRVSQIRQLKRFFAADCVVYHPPRDHREKVQKLRRVSEGQKDLLRLDSERFSFLDKQQRFAGRIKALLPPSWKSVCTIYEHDPRFSKWQLYRYMYRIKRSKAAIS